jgi:hypothetical protein
LLREQCGREWLFIGEDFDKSGIPSMLTETFFVAHANVLRDLRANLIFTVPIGLVYSERGPQLAFPPDRIHCIPDTPVFNRQHKAHGAGMNAIRRVLEARVAPDLFEPGQADSLIVASGGNLRDLFSLVAEASDTALLRKAAKIGEADVTSAIRELRNVYLRRLGQSPFDAAEVSYPDKAARLVGIYDNEPDASVPDKVLYSLLHARAVQEFNRERWFGVHPLVVDLLVDQKRLGHDGSSVPGGTR